MEEEVVVKQQYCAAVRKQVQLVETRVFPESDFLSMDEYRIKKTECALGLECSMDDHSGRGGRTCAAAPKSPCSSTARLIKPTRP